MKKSKEYRDFDRIHVLQLFDLIAESEYDAFAMIEGYASTKCRKRADEGEPYYVFRQATNQFNDILMEGDIPSKKMDVDPVVLHWLADFYLYGFYEKDLSFEQSMDRINPNWLYNHYSPLHETSIANAWDKASSCAKAI